MNSSSLPALHEFLETDLNYICGGVRKEFSRLAGKRLLVTGGAGFLGYYLALSVLHHNKTAGPGDAIDLTIWDNFIRGTPRWLSDLHGTPHLTIENRDLIKPLPSPMRDFQWIIHAAGIASPTYYRKYPLETIDSNINGLRNLLEYCVSQRDQGLPVEGLLFFSSSEIYGDPAPEWIPTPEHYRGFVSCTGPRACYDESKRFGETFCVVFAQQHGIPVKIARPFNNYGPGLKITDRPGHSGLCAGCARRSRCGHVLGWQADQNVLLFGRLDQRLLQGARQRKPGESYNIGIDRPEISMNALAEKIISTARELFGYGGRLVHAASAETVYLVDNPNRRCPNMQKSMTQLGYAPEHTG